MSKKTLSIQTRLDKNNFSRLKDAAYKKGISISMMVRIILIQYLEGIHNVQS